MVDPRTQLENRKHQAVETALSNGRPYRVPSYVGFWQILLQNPLLASAIDDSLALTRFAAEVGDDGTPQSRSTAAVLFILS